MNPHDARVISVYRSFLGSRLGLAISAIVLPSGLLAGCDAGEGVRAGRLHNVVVLDNQVFLETEPALASGKLAKMDLDLYTYFRGGAGCYARDFAQGGAPGYLPTDYLSEDAADVALIGGPPPREHRQLSAQQRRPFGHRLQRL
ncbi:MAG TPA: hypothetical protein ENJ18_11180 [Nannocystis exedens]|nr:hypothetical protein [Nannocystis exedens]